MRIANLNPDSAIGASAWFVELEGHRLLMDAGTHPKRDGRDSLPLYARWPLCFAMLAVPYWLLGRGFEAKFTKREYRFAN